MRALIQSTITSKQHEEKEQKQQDPAADKTDELKYSPTFRSIMEKKISNKLLIILTYDFTKKLDSNSSHDFLKDTTIIKRMREFSKADEFELYINRYLRRNSKRDLLLP